MTATGPVFLRWRPERAALPETERFDDLDALLDSLETRWDELRELAPQVLDQRKVLLISTEELKREFEADPPA